LREGDSRLPAFLMVNVKPPPPNATPGEPLSVKVNLPSRRHRYADNVFRGVTRFFTVFVLLILAGIIVTLFSGSLPALREFGARFFITAEWNPVTDIYGGLVPIVGTLVTSLIAMAIAVPISFGIAVFLTHIAPPWLRRPLGVTIELLAAVPSIIYGMWGLFVLAPFLAADVYPWINDNLGQWPVIGQFFQGPPMGIGILTAGLILAIMVIPFISAVMRDVFQVVPVLLKESAFGLGSTTWEVVWHVVLPYTRVGVIGGVLLGLGRALGETMAVTFVIGNAHRLSASLLMPGNTISAALANEFTEAVGELYLSSLILLGMTLFGITFIVLSLSKLVLLRLEKRAGRQA
jgi:phosphate transport system permease protein